MPERYDSDLQIRFHRTDAHGGNSVPADILATTLRSLQTVVYLLAASHCRVETHGGERSIPVPVDIRRRYAVTCHLPESGSYAIPVTIAGPPAPPPTDAAPNVLDDLRTLLRATQNHSEDDLDRLFPAPVTRVAATRALYNMVPRPRSGAGVAIESSAGEPIFAPDGGTRRFLKSLTAHPTGESEQSVVGRLNEIDFQKQRIRLRHPPSGRELSCLYHAQAEPMLIDCRRNLIQVVGEITLGPDEAPKRIRRVDSICRVDVSPMEVTGFNSGTDRVRAKRPLAFQPAIHDGYKHFVLRDAPFGVHLLSATREELEANLLEELDTIWRHFACADDADLMPDAQALKRELHNAFSSA